MDGLPCNISRGRDRTEESCLLHFWAALDDVVDSGVFVDEEDTGNSAEVSRDHDPEAFGAR
jgi:hypothetical protein